MATAANATQLYKYPFLRMPLGLPKLSAGAALVVGEVFSFTGKDRHGNEMTCRRTYQSLTERTGKSRATVGRALHTTKALNLIKLDKDKGYVCEVENPADFLRCPQFLTSEEFKIRRIKRKLIGNEVRVYAYLFTRCDNRKNKDKVCFASISQIAATLNISEKTVYKAIWALLRAGLIYRPKKDKGLNGYVLSRYTLNTAILREHGVYITENVQSEPAAAPSSETSTEWTKERAEQYYYDKRAHAELMAERNLIKARENERFKLADEVYKSMSIAAAFAFREPDKAQEYERRAARAKGERLAALKELGLTEQDLIPQYECKLCNDTGYRIDTGQRCKCLPPGGGV